ncbi:Replication protein O [Bacillus toyonensis]
MTGWIKLHRKIMHNPIFHDFQLYRLWSICLMSANHAKGQVVIDGNVVGIEEGQFVIGRFSLYDLYNRGLSPKDKVRGEKTPYRWLEKLENLGYLTLEKTSKYTVVTIVNWGFYQGSDQESDHQVDQQMTIKRPTDDHQMTTNKNVKNDKNDKNEKKKNTSRHKYETCDMNAAKYLFEKIKENNPKQKEPSAFDSWANEVRLMRERDKRDLQEIKDVIDWCQKDSFWKSNILSVALKIQ